MDKRTIDGIFFLVILIFGMIAGYALAEQKAQNDAVKVANMIIADYENAHRDYSGINFSLNLSREINGKHD
jgi:hypothetical protein